MGIPPISEVLGDIYSIYASTRQLRQEGSTCPRVVVGRFIGDGNMEVPGPVRSRWSLLSDESIEFVRKPREYLQSRVEAYGHTFSGRIVNRPVVFLTSNRGVEELLNDELKIFSSGYKEYFYELFDASLPFLEDGSWEGVHAAMATAFHPERGAEYCQQSRSLIRKFYSELDTSKPVVVYEIFKQLATRLSVFLFLGIPLDDPLFEEVSQLMTTHWRGCISIPVNVRIPLLSFQSGYAKALKAKERLLAIIRERVDTSLAGSDLKQHLTEDEVCLNVLMFVSALIPKAFGALLTSLIVALEDPANVKWKECHKDPEQLSHVLLEVQRLWPPFLGGYRICKDDCNIEGFKIPKDSIVAYIASFANRDETVFPQPDAFRPERWKDENADDRNKVFTFGGGLRCCVGRDLSQKLLQECVHAFCEQFHCELLPKQNIEYKTLPISRPKGEIFVKLTRKDVGSPETHLSQH